MARAKHLLVTQRDPEIGAAISSAWWYPKNMLIFAPKETTDGVTIDRALLAHPAEANMLSSAYLEMMGPGEFGKMWTRDWKEFGTLFYDRGPRGGKAEVQQNGRRAYQW
ncbi:hypothetical protein THAOC_18866 [Thalassiosira oceanica]|uniref:Uncharacterized protein n=1 Tax=Thalassiosira oceanica TaxID=159749 RepID=K0S3W6_THAOC|nr:hypothetical protein THAOC_18866 [Thalassiosira oceanica]|eukprot:EJK60733.1 hypothetical protein THAOC_18866 [Thalassiosira oceanica]